MLLLFPSCDGSSLNVRTKEFDDEKGTLLLGFKLLCPHAPRVPPPESLKRTTNDCSDYAVTK
jgi:hypothetical protein